jgi:peroxiredoxin family protein
MMPQKHTVNSEVLPLNALALIQSETEALRAELDRRLTEIERRLPQDKVSIVVFSSDLDRVLAGFVIANGALALGMEVSMYFTFWGLAAVRKATCADGKAFKQRLMGLFTPARTEEMGLSKLNMLGLGPRMMRGLMREKNVASLEDLRMLAQEQGTRMIGCTMAMDVMGVDAAELIEGVELGGVATFLEDALRSRTTVFI